MNPLRVRTGWSPLTVKLWRIPSNGPNKSLPNTQYTIYNIWAHGKSTLFKKHPYFSMAILLVKCEYARLTWLIRKERKGIILQNIEYLTFLYSRRIWVPHLYHVGDCFSLPRLMWGVDTLACGGRGWVHRPKSYDFTETLVFYIIFSLYGPLEQEY